MHASGNHQLSVSSFVGENITEVTNALKIIDVWVKKKALETKNI